MYIQYRNNHGVFVKGAITAASVLMLSACGGGGGGGDGGIGGGSGGGSGGGVASNAVAQAGEEMTVARNTQVNLDASGSSDPDGDTLSYQWVQTFGPDVTGGAGELSGVTPGFTAPFGVSTLSFELRVSDGNGSPATDSVQVNVLENTEGAIFVDGDNGSDDSGDGARGNPFATISFAVQYINDNFSDEDYDVYVKNLASDARYDERDATIAPGARTSLYGGYGDSWVRNVSTPTGLDGNSQSISVRDTAEQSWVSGFDIDAMGSDNSQALVAGISAQSGDGMLFIEDNVIVAGNVGEGETISPASSYGLRIASLGAVRIYRNAITAGAGGQGNSGLDRSLSAGLDGESGNQGKNGGPGDKGAGGDGGDLSFRDAQDRINAGGDGGDAGTVANQNGDQGNRGASAEGIFFGSGGIGGGGGGTSEGGYRVTHGLRDGSGYPGDGGGGGQGGDPGDGGDGYGSFSTGGFYVLARGTGGESGRPGSGGGGGGGGEASGFGFDGGGGGGGGAGGAPGNGSPAAISGGASIAIALGSSDAIIEDNVITANRGGDGGNAASGSDGGRGGTGNFGGAGDSSNAGVGGWGGGGGGAGAGGMGGGGGGGPSFAILVGAGAMPVINNNEITSGNGGGGGIGGVGGLHGNSGLPGYILSEQSNGGSCCVGQPELAGVFSEGGYSYGIFDADTNDGASPMYEGNVFTVGSPGEGDAEHGGKAGLFGEANF